MLLRMLSSALNSLSVMLALIDTGGTKLHFSVIYWLFRVLSSFHEK